MRIEMRSDERGPKTVGFRVTNDRRYFVTRSEGGVEHDFRLRSTTTTFVYMPHSAVVIPRESARNVARKEKGGDESDPPQKNRGVMRTRIAGIWNMPLSRSPWGRSRPHLSLREGSKQPPRSGADGRETDLCAIPFPLALHCVGSVLAVKGTLRRFAPWTACGPIRKTRCSRGKRGVVGSGRKGTFRSYQPP